MVIKYHVDGKLIHRRDMSKIYVGRIVHSKSLSNLEILPNAAIGVSHDTIKFVASHFRSEEELKSSYGGDEFNDAEVIRLKSSQFLFPGMVDTHLHAPQYPNLALGMDGKLREWMVDWTDPIEASYSDNDKARRVYADLVKTTLKLGTTTVAYNSTIHAEATNILADAAFKAGQRAIIGKMCITHGSTHGNREESNETSLADSEKSIKYMQSIDPDRRLISPCVMPRGGPWCPEALMRALGDQTKQYDAHGQMHMCETLDDIDETLKLHPGYGCYSDMYRTNGLLNSKSILAHCVHLRPKDFENLKETKAGVAHNPNSNTCLRDGECRVRDLLDYGIKVGLGTDCSAGYMPSIHDAMRNASNVSRHLAMKTDEDRYVLKFNELVYLATVGGAQVVDMEDRIGNFVAGKKFDALIVDVEGVISAELGIKEHGEDDSSVMVKKWVFLGDDRNIRKVFVGGELVAGHDLD